MLTPSLRASFLLLATATLAACTGAPAQDPRDRRGDDTGDEDDDTTDTGDTVDSGAVDETAVWRNYRVETSATLQGVYASGQGVYVIGTEGRAFVGGASTPWVAMDPPVDGVNLTDLWGTGAAETILMYATAEQGLVAKYTQSGWVTEDLGTANHVGAGGSGPDAMYVVGFGGVYRFDGTTWNYEAVPGNVRLNDVFAVGLEAYAVGEGGVILRRDSATSAWTEMESGTDADLNSVTGFSLDNAWAVGADGTALRYDGSRWQATATGVTVPLWSVFAPNATDVFAVGNNGVALRFRGGAWETMPTGVSNNLYSVHGVSAANMWAVGNRGTALQFKEQ
jgi:hypothetical protein